MISNLFLNEGTPQNGYQWIFVALLVVLVVVLLVVPMFTNKKRAKQTTEMHNSLKPGDVIKTVGGIIGTIKEVRQVSPTEKEMVIETGDGDNKTTMVFDIQALYQIMSRAEAPAAEPAAAPTEVFENETHETADQPVADEQKEQPVAEEAPAQPTEEPAAAETTEQPEVAEHEEEVVAPVDETATTAAEQPAEEPKQKAAPKAKASQAPKSNSSAKKSTAKNSTKK